MNAKVVLTNGRIPQGSVLYYFDFKSWQFAEARSAKSETHTHLSLGNSLGEWHKAIEGRRTQIYDDIIRESVDFLPTLNANWNSVRHAEILLGHLARQVALRIARAEAQTKLLPRVIDVEEETIQFQLPAGGFLNYSEAQSLLRGASIARLIEAKCLELRFGIKFSFVDIATSPSLPNEGSDERNFTENLYLSLNRFFAYFTRRNKILIVNSYMGRLREMALHLRLLQFPLLSEIRPKRSRQLDRTHSHDNSLLARASSLENLGLEIVKALLPNFLLDSAESQKARFFELGWPSNPRLVFTSNSYATDDEFCTYVADHISTITYVVGQHGNNYRVSNRMGPDPEINSADYFMSWGWESENVIPLGVLKPKLKTTAKPKRLLILLRPEQSPDLGVDACAFDQRYVDGINRFLKNLATNHVRAVIRFHSSSWPLLEETVRHTVSRNQEFLSLSVGTSIRRDLRSASLPVFTYDSSGMLEAGVSGGCFLFFAVDGIGHVRSPFVGNYQKLAASGVMSSSPETMALIARGIIRRGLTETHKGGISDFLVGIASPLSSPVRSVAGFLSVFVRADVGNPNGDGDRS